MRRAVLLGLIAVVCWSLIIGSAVAGDVTPMAAQGGGKGSQVKAPAPLPRTGQTDSYGPGDDGTMQKGVAWPVPRFIDNGDGTVIDRLTGLVWLKNANCISTNYPTFDNDVSPAPETSNVPGDGKVLWQHALDFVAGINDGTYPNCGAGYTDWRLPNIRELLSLIDYGYSHPCLSNGAGTGHFSQGDPFINVMVTYTGDDDYWTSTSDANGPVDSAWAFELIVCAPVRVAKVGGRYVWPVRGGK
jgi:Protein of unknown function (DUF1566)